MPRRCRDHGAVGNQDNRLACPLVEPEKDLHNLLGCGGMLCLSRLPLLARRQGRLEDGLGHRGRLGGAGAGHLLDQGQG